MKNNIDRHTILNIILENGWTANYSYSSELTKGSIITMLVLGMKNRKPMRSHFMMNSAMKVISLGEVELRLYFLIYLLVSRIRSLTSSCTKCDYAYLILFIRNKLSREVDFDCLDLDEPILNLRMDSPNG